MLDTLIIKEILRREEEKRGRPPLIELPLERPLPVPSVAPQPKEERGVYVIDI